MSKVFKRKNSGLENSCRKYRYKHHLPLLKLPKSIQFVPKCETASKITTKHQTKYKQWSSYLLHSICSWCNTVSSGTYSLEGIPLGYFDNIFAVTCNLWRWLHNLYLTCYNDIRTLCVTYDVWGCYSHVLVLANKPDYSFMAGENGSSFAAVRGIVCSIYMYINLYQ